MEDISLWESQYLSCGYSERLLNKICLLNETVKNKNTKNTVDIIEVKKAIYYAKKYHGEQRRDSGEPYYSHPLEVAYMISDYLFRTDIIITSILHDTLEDTELTFKMIENAFGQVVANQVMDLTRKNENGRRISSAEIVSSLFKQKKYEVLLIKQFDRLHNMQTIGAKSPEKIEKIVEETFKMFIVFAMHAQLQNLEKIMYQLCCKTLSIETVPYGFSQATTNDSHLASLEGTDNHLLVSQVFQNVTTPIKS